MPDSAVHRSTMSDNSVTANQVKLCEAELNKYSEKFKDDENLKKYFSGFIKLYNNFLTTKPLSWEKINPPKSEKIQNYTELKDLEKNEYASILKRLVVVKLNGGLGTTMGCSFPKSLITVRDNMNFLDMNVLQLETLNQQYDSNVPLVLMNSFSTAEDTQKVLNKYSLYKTKIFTFMQSKYPRISGDTLMPICLSSNPTESSIWYPPGHGNFYESFYESGLMEKFINEGRDLLFISNIDNLGATVDLKILRYFSEKVSSENPVEFIMEVTDKTRADVKGGTLVMYEDTLRLLEIAQVPSKHIEDFKSVSKFRVFNTNNIWMNLNKILEKIKGEQIKLDYISNKKTLQNGSSIIQLETAIGSAIQNFKGSMGINVPRSRFLPVKSNSDLLLVMSNLYSYADGKLFMNPKRMFQSTPIIQLSGISFKSVKEFLQRFPSIPDILELDYLSVSGDVTFGRDIVLRGTVIILAPHEQHIDIPSGSVIENKIISGNLRVVDL